MTERDRAEEPRRVRRANPDTGKQAEERGRGPREGRRRTPWGRRADACRAAGG